MIRIIARAHLQPMGNTQNSKPRPLTVNLQTSGLYFSQQYSLQYYGTTMVPIGTTTVLLRYHDYFFLVLS